MSKSERLEMADRFLALADRCDRRTPFFSSDPIGHRYWRIRSYNFARCAAVLDDSVWV